MNWWINGIILAFNTSSDVQAATFMIHFHLFIRTMLFHKCFWPITLNCFLHENMFPVMTPVLCFFHAWQVYPNIIQLNCSGHVVIRLAVINRQVGLRQALDVIRRELFAQDNTARWSSLTVRVLVYSSMQKYILIGVDFPFIVKIVVKIKLEFYNF